MSAACNHAMPSATCDCALLPTPARAACLAWRIVPIPARSAGPEATDG